MSWNYNLPKHLRTVEWYRECARQIRAREFCNFSLTADIIEDLTDKHATTISFADALKEKIDVVEKCVEKIGQEIHKKQFLRDTFVRVPAGGENDDWNDSFVGLYTGVSRKKEDGSFELQIQRQYGPVHYVDELRLEAIEPGEGWDLDDE